VRDACRHQLGRGAGRRHLAGRSLRGEDEDALTATGDAPVALPPAFGLVLIVQFGDLDIADPPGVDQRLPRPPMPAAAGTRSTGSGPCGKIAARSAPRR
jgi:hypothetical protein